MLKRLIIVFSLLVSSSYSSFILASDIHGRYWIYGVGRQTCKTYLDARHNGGYSEISYKNWVSGYLTSVNRSADDTYNLLGQNDFQGAMAWLDQYCEKQPDNTIYMAIDNMVAVMMPQRRRSK